MRGRSPLSFGEEGGIFRGQPARTAAPGKRSPDMLVRFFVNLWVTARNIPVRGVERRFPPGSLRRGRSRWLWWIQAQGCIREPLSDVRPILSPGATLTRRGRVRFGLGDRKGDSRGPQRQDLGGQPARPRSQVHRLLASALTLQLPSYPFGTILQGTDEKCTRCGEGR